VASASIIETPLKVVSSDMAKTGIAERVLTATAEVRG
jgi:hypothetical protein